MRRVESMPELGEARASVSQETAHALRSAKNSDESTEDAFAMATSERRATTKTRGRSETKRRRRERRRRARAATRRLRTSAVLSIENPRC